MGKNKAESTGTIVFNDSERLKSEVLCADWRSRRGEAEPLLTEGYEGMTARKNSMAIADRYYLDRGHELLVKMYIAWHKPEKAAEWRKK